MHMNEGAQRRQFLQHLALAGGVGWLAPFRAWAQAAPARAAPRAELTPAEKEKLKAELQRDLERKVYSVDEALFRKVNRAADPKRYQGHERGHVPKIVAPREVRRLEAFAVRVRVGVEEIHEMQPFHYVDWITLAVDNVQVGFASVAPIFCRPIVEFQITLESDAVLYAQEHCNLHGTWESEPWRIRVVE